MELVARALVALGVLVAPCLVPAAVCGQASEPKAVPPPVATGKAVANDNRTPGGTLRDGTLTLRLVATTVEWRPEGEGPGDPVRIAQAFAEEGRTPQIPGPVVRVPEGTDIRVSITNGIPGATLAVHGMMTRPDDADVPVEIAPGTTRDLHFEAGAPGTYFYWATTTGVPIDDRVFMDATLTGAFIVDPRRGAETDDRTFIMTEFFGPPGPGGIEVASLAINGRSWPYTERMEMRFGQPATWRVINATFGLHPMHLHGTFYTVESVGTVGRNTTYDAESRRLVTTEAMPSGGTMMMRWVPDRVGKWLFHCHIQGHVTGDLRLGDRPPGDHGAGHDGGEHSIEQSMAGLVLGIIVHPGDETAAPDLHPHAARPVTLKLIDWANGYGAGPGYGFAIDDPRRPPPPADPAAPVPPPGAPPQEPSPTLVLQKDEPVVISLVNTTKESTSIHWHGIELESYSDGVAGWSGDTRQTTKLVHPGESLDVRFTPPRAGTFIYHTHGHDARLLSSGMYAPLIVMPAGKTYDAETDKVVLLGGSGPASSDFGPAPIEVNRSLNPPPMTLKVGTKYRFRLIDITPNYSAHVTLRGDDGLVEWRAVAKDGADLPPSQATVRPARQAISVGETYDFEFEPKAPGDLRLEVVRRGYPLVTSQFVRVAKDETK